MEEDICHNANRQAEYDLLNFCNISKKETYRNIRFNGVTEGTNKCVLSLQTHIPNKPITTETQTGKQWCFICWNIAWE